MTPPEAPSHVALVDDDPTLRMVVRAWLERAGYAVREYPSGMAFLDDTAAPPNAVLLDLGLGDMAGLDVLRHFKSRSPDVPVLVVTARREVDSAVAAMRAGASDYLAKPLDPERTLSAVAEALERAATAALVRDRLIETSESTIADALLARSTAMREFSRRLERVLNSDATVCLLGESGSGKEVAARILHDRGRRRRGPFVAINCAAIPHALQESELFGHEKGAFTGAVATHKGRFEQAHGGTLFLDEVGEMSPALQASLLRAIQERSIRRVGGAVDLPVDVRIVCATHRDLEAEVSAGRFRQDLFFRLMVYPTRVPPLRERVDDLPLLIGHFLRRLRPDVGRDVDRITPDALAALGAHTWSGNVRELQNVLHRAMLSTDDDEIDLPHLPPELQRRVLPPLPSHRAPEPAAVDPAQTEALLGPSGTVPTLAELERRAIDRALVATDGNVGRAARLLGIGRTTLYRRLNELGLLPRAE
jgi:DNA-binding NtrC family response regulator